MNRRTFCCLASSALIALRTQPLLALGSKRTEIAIRGEDFYLNGKPTYAGRSWQGLRIEGLLMNSRMVQGIFDDANPETRGRWAYPDTRTWDAERNSREFIAAMPEWRRDGLLCFTINLQGGSPEGYSQGQPWDNTALDSEAVPKPAYFARVRRILDEADRLGTVVILGCYYFGQDQRVKDEAAVKRGVVETAHWVLRNGYRNVLLEIANECDIEAYDHAILKPARIHELIDLAKSIDHRGRRLLVATSFKGGAVPTSNVVKASDFLLVHGNGPEDPSRITRLITETRKVDGYRPMPIVVNEDDHFRFDESDNHMNAALKLHASWGYFDPGANNYVDGYQCPPVNWSINTERKKAFFAKLKSVTGA